MHFYTLSLALLASTLPATFAAVPAVIEAGPETTVSPNNLFARADPAIGTALCTAPIVNLYAYSSANCTNNYQQGTSETRNSPIPYGLKFAPYKPAQLTTFQSDCKNAYLLTVDGNPARALAFSADGPLTDRCKIQVFAEEGCAGEVSKSYNLDGFGGGSGVGDCQARNWRSARVVCDRTRVNNP
jgi:hypothetical protein